MNKFEIDEDLKDLQDLLTKIFQDEKYFDNIKLLNYLNKKFADKNMPISIPNQLFMDLITLDQLTEEQLIWLVQCMYDYVEGDKKMFKELNPEKFFSAVRIREVYEFVDENETLDSLVFHNVDKIGESQYICSFVPVEDIAKFKASGLFSYNFETQRQAKKMRPIGTEGAVVKEITTNQKSIDAIAELIYQNKFRANMITLNVPNIEGKNPDIKYDDKTRTLEITPHYEPLKDNLTTVNVIDGWHRICASEEAYNKAKSTKHTLRDGFIFSINIMTPSEAKFHFKRENTYNPIDKNYLKTFEVSDESKFIDALVEWSEEGKENIFKNKVCKMYEELKITQSYTWINPLIDAIKQTNFNYKNVLQHKYIIPKIVDFITLLIENINYYYYTAEKDRYKKLKETTDLLSPNVFIGYIAIANKISNIDEVPSYVESMIKILMSDKVKNDLKEMGLNKKNYSAKKIYGYFNELI